MFGDKLLVGHYESTVDSKNRIVLPAATKREKDDTVILIYDEESNAYKFYSEQAIKTVFEMYKLAIINAKDEKEKAFYKKELEIFSDQALKSCRVDAQGRIALTGFVEAGEEIEFHGRGDHLVLKRTKNK